MTDGFRDVISRSTVLIFSAILAAGLIVAGWVLGSQIKQTRLADHYVTVRGLAERTVKSDLAIWTINFQASGDDFNAVLAQNESQRPKVLAFLKQQGVEDSEVTIAAPRMIDKDAREYGARQANESRYLVTQSVTVISPNVDRISAASQKAGELLKEGVLLASSQSGSGALSYKFTGLNKIKPDMITEATKNARAAAERFAKDSGATVGPIRQATQGLFSISAADAGSASSGENGFAQQSPDASIMKNVRVVTTIDYYLEQ